MSNLLKYLLALALACGLGYAGGRYLQPAKVETKEVQVVKHDVRIVERIITRPDGSTETERTIDDHTVDTTKKTSKVNNVKPQWRASLMVSKKVDTVLDLPAYGLSVEKRFMGPVFLGAFVDTHHTVGLSVGIEF